MRVFFALLISLTATCWAYSTTTIISGNDSRYAGKEIVFLENTDPFTGKEHELGSAIVDSNGVFSIELDIIETKYIFSFQGNKKLHLFVEPGMKYNIILPEYVEYTQSDKLNPFFKYVEVHLATETFKEKDLNIQIRMFLDAYLPYFNKHIENAFTGFDFSQLDQDIEKMEKPFTKSKNKYFNEFRDYKYGMLRFLAYQHKSKFISNEYFKDRPVLINNPAYLDLFNKVYTGYFSHFVRADKENKLVNALSKEKTFTSLSNALSGDEVLQPNELLNLVALKCLYEEFYDDNYSRNSMLEVLKSFLTGDAPEYQKKIARNIIDEVTRLLVGFEPPKFELYDVDSNLVSIENYRGKFVYLNFCSCFSYSCLNEFAQLQLLYEKHKEYLEIVSIVIDDDVQVMKDFVQRSGYTWTFLHFGNQPTILKEYDIRIFPTYYLIDNEGKLVQSPAATPNEAFEGRLFKELRAKGIL